MGKWTLVWIVKSSRNSNWLDMLLRVFTDRHRILTLILLNEICSSRLLTINLRGCVIWQERSYESNDRYLHTQRHWHYSQHQPGMRLRLTRAWSQLAFRSNSLRAACPSTTVIHSQHQSNLRFWFIHRKQNKNKIKRSRILAVYRLHHTVLRPYWMPLTTWWYRNAGVRSN